MNTSTVDAGALKMALNVLRRAGKNEVADALESTTVYKPSPAGQGDARDIIAEFLQCADAGRPPGKLLAQARDFLAARQPVGHEPFAWISRIRCVGPEYGKEIYGKLPVQSLNPLYYEHIPLYAAPPAQAVDLGQLQKFAAAAVEFFDHGYDGHGRAKLNELLALIDSQGGE